jgi:molybdopterin converting factor small subunit
VSELIDLATERYGPSFAALLPTCRIWLNGEDVDRATAITDRDEIAVLPPVSGGS